MDYTLYELWQIGCEEVYDELPEDEEEEVEDDIFVDMWYGDDMRDIDKITMSFSDCDCEYRGNVYINGKMVGDYTTANSVCVLERIQRLADRVRR